MKITGLKLHPVAAERQYGTVIAKAGGGARTAVARSHFYFLELQAAGDHVGWGEISDVPLEELPPDPDEYGAMLAEMVVGRDVYDLQRLHHDLREHWDFGGGHALPRYASCALDMAMLDLQGQAAKRPVYDLLGGALRRDVAISWVAFIREDLDALREEIQAKRRAGFFAYKLKVGVDFDLDEQRLAILREQAGGEAEIKIDANEGWDVAAAIRNIKRLGRYHLAGVETPVPRQDPRAIAAVRKAVEVPIIEHVNTLEYGLALVKAGAVDVFNIATTNAGGIWPARQIVALAQAAEIGILLGSTVELGPGTLAQLHLAATVPNLTLPSDLVGPGLYRQSVLSRPLVYKQGRLPVPQGPGLGQHPDRERLAALRF